MITLLYRRTDGSFVANVNGLPYHITEDDQLFGEAQDLADDMGDDLGFEPPPPDPAALVQPYLNNGGLIRFSANPVVVAENIRFAGASRLARGRYRATHLTPYPNDQYSATPSVKDPNRCTIQVTNRTATFVEVRVWDATGVLYDPQEITITTERVVTP